MLPAHIESKIEFGREVCGVLEQAEDREWLVTNGIGGYASGTISGNLTRRYHGLLVAALRPPLGRTLLIAKLEESVIYDGAEYPLSTNRWSSGTVAPKGFANIESFGLEGSVPVWRFAFADGLLEKRIWMRQNENTTYVQYTTLRGGGPIRLACKAFVNYRDFHGATHAGNWKMSIHPAPNGLKIVAFEGAVPFYLLAPGAGVAWRHEWYRDFYFPLEAERGLDASEDCLFAATFSRELPSGQTLTFVLTCEETPELDGEKALRERREQDKALLRAWAAHDPMAAETAPPWIRQLVLAADQFIVKRSLPQEPDGRSIIAGYHWFGDWGRDTMIALPGLTLVTGRAEVAAKILRAFACCIDRGMLPNNFPDAGGIPEYNTVDAALWFIEAARQYFEAARDLETLRFLYPVFAEIIRAYNDGTRHNIRVDHRDGLLHAGEAGVQLTWMDAKIGDWVVTPRIGKPVEVNALWYNALLAMADFSVALGVAPDSYQEAAGKALRNFGKFWNDGAGYCYDVIDAPGIGCDAALRPNPIFAVSLAHSPLSSEQQRAIVDVCARRLLTSFGLRSLAPGEPGYAGHYAGGPHERDAAYHQGTAWGWLLGPFALAHLRVYRDARAAASFLEPLGNQVRANGLGTLGEVFDGDAPFTPRGCIAQAWTVAELLRAWRTTLAGLKDGSKLVARDGDAGSGRAAPAS
jgi:predicted glycogen debranching enzyme